MSISQAAPVVYPPNVLQKLEERRLSRRDGDWKRKVDALTAERGEAESLLGQLKTDRARSEMLLGESRRQLDYHRSEIEKHETALAAFRESEAESTRALVAIEQKLRELWS